MEKHVKQKLRQFGVRPGDVVGAAVSGGVDSMVLLHVLCNLRAEMNIIIVVFHMEHGIRGAQSERDMRFVQDACEKLGVKCIVCRKDVPALARQKGVSVETAARMERYAFLDAQDADFIATAHHAGDAAETVIMNLCRGSGLSGLCGIPEVRGRYVRPLLEITREEIESYAAKRGIDHVFDSTNDDTAYTRNYVRAKILPGLKAVNARAQSHIVQTAKLLAEDEAALCEAARRAGGVDISPGKQAVIDIKTLTEQHPAIQKRMIRLALQRAFGLKDIERVHVSDLLALAHNAVSGKRVELSRGLAAAVVYGKLSIGINKETQYNKFLVDFCGPGRYVLGDTVITCETGEPVFLRDAEVFDAKTLDGASFRRRRQGDFIRPLGMHGKKRLSDYLSDRKVPLAWRDALIVLAKGSEVFWVVGVGVSETSKVNNNASCFRFYYDGGPGE